MNKINIIALFTFLITLSAYSCDNLPKIDETGEKGSLKHNVAYIKEMANGSQARFTVNDEGGSTIITPRLGNLSNNNTTLKIKIDKTILEKYNNTNKTSFKVLPEAAYDIQVTDKDGKVVQEGKEITLTLAPKQYAQKIKINVKTMMQEEVDAKTGKTKKTPLSYYSNYAIPVKISEANNGVKIQTKGSSGILFVNRKFEMKVMHLDGRLGLIYKKDTRPQKPGAIYENDVKYPEWTCQYSFMLDRVNNNTGLLYPNLRTNTNSNLYNTLYSGSLTLFAGAGKVGLNQPGFTEFKFEAKKWYHMAISFKDEAGRPVLRLFVNGKLAYKSIWPKKVDQWPIIYMGNSSFQGYVRELRFWSRALTEGEVNETLWFVDPKTKGLEVYLPLSKDKKGIIPGKEQDWIDISTGKTHFNDTFTFPAED